MKYKFDPIYTISENTVKNAIAENILWIALKQRVGYTIIDINVCPVKDKSKVIEIFDVLYKHVSKEHRALWNNTFWFTHNYKYIICNINNKKYIIVYEHIGNDVWNERFLIMPSNVFEFKE